MQFFTFLIFFILGCVTAITRAHEHYTRFTTGHLKEIPKRFEITGENPMPKFNKYITDIQDLAFQKNQSVLYKVKVDLVKPDTFLKKRKKAALSKIKSKKFNVPLKKQSMKLSNFEVLIRKLAEENGHGINNQNKDLVPSETTETIIPSTARHTQLKFKPVIGGVKTKYAKVIKPVRNKVITLT